MSNVDRRQFYIANQPLVRDDFKTLALSCGLILSYHHELKVTVAGDNVLLGHAFSCIKEEIDISNGVNEMHEWSGRWVLITKDALYLDACGTLGVFYGRDENGNMTLSSSLHLLSESLKKEWIADYQVKRGDFVMFDFYPIPFTPYKDIMALLPTQYISLPKGDVLPRTDYDFLRYQHLDVGAVKEKFIDCFTKVLENIHREFGDEVWIPMTGGVDSRTIFALAHKAGIPFQTYTLIRDDLKPWDRKIPFKIAKKTKISHRLIDSRINPKDHSERFDDILSHCGGNVTVGTEVIQYLSGADVPVKNKSIVLWGTVWETIQGYYDPYFGKENNGDADIVSAYKKLCGNMMEVSNIHRMSINAWLKNVQLNSISGVDFKMRQYLDQRVGAWVMYAAQMFDMFDSIRISPINCQFMLELLLPGNDFSMPVSDPLYGKKLQMEIIKQCDEPLSKMPYGEPSDFFYRLRRKIGRILHLT